MTIDEKTAHWDARYARTRPEDLSWFEAAPDLSLSLIRQAVPPEAAVIDVGGGASRLPDRLLEAGYQDVTVLDLSEQALSLSRSRLGARAGDISWQVADVTLWLAERRYDLWHDRAVFHFLTERADRAAYVATLGHALKPRGVAVLMTFASDGPEMCSGLPVRRYTSDALAEEVESLAPGAFEVLEAGRFFHVTPGGVEQRFQFTVLRRA